MAVARAACVCSFLAFAYHAVVWTPRLTYGFAMYYTYARLVLEGETLRGAYDEEHFNAKVREFGFHVRDEPNNLPTAALAYIPVAWAGPTAAKVLWTGVSLALYGWSLALLFSLSRIPAGNLPGLMLLTLAFLWHPAWQTIALGQVYMLVLLLFLLFIRQLSRTRDRAAGMFLALVAIVKGYGAVPGILLAVKGKWKIIGISAGTAVVVVLATLPMLGADSWGEFYGSVLTPLGSRPQDANATYQTLNGFLRHLFTFDPLWLAHPLVAAAPWVATTVSYAVSLVLVIAALLVFGNAGEGEHLLAYGGAIAAGVFTAPLAEEYHYVLLLPLLFGLAARCLAWRVEGGKAGLPEWLGAAAALGAAAPTLAHTFQDAAYPLVLLAYIKLAAGLSMLGAAALAIRRGRHVPPPAIPA